MERTEIETAMQANIAGCLGELLRGLGAAAWPAELRAALLRELARQAIDAALPLEAADDSELRPSAIRRALRELAPAMQQLERLGRELPASAEQLEPVRRRVSGCLQRLEDFERFNPPPRRRQVAGRA